MKIPTEPIGSVPRPLALLDAVDAYGAHSPLLDEQYLAAIREHRRQIRGKRLARGERRRAAQIP